jgi:hypothetical protein
MSRLGDGLKSSLRSRSDEGPAIGCVLGRWCGQSGLTPGPRTCAVRGSVGLFACGSSGI